MKLDLSDPAAILARPEGKLSAITISRREKKTSLQIRIFSIIWGLRLLPIIFFVKKISNEDDCCVDYHDFKDPEPVKLKVSPIYSSDLHDFKVKELSRKCQTP